MHFFILLLLILVPVTAQSASQKDQQSNKSLGLAEKANDSLQQALDKMDKEYCNDCLPQIMARHVGTFYAQGEHIVFQLSCISGNDICYNNVVLKTNVGNAEIANLGCSNSTSQVQVVLSSGHGSPDELIEEFDFKPKNIVIRKAAAKVIRHQRQGAPDQDLGVQDIKKMIVKDDFKPLEVVIGK